MNIKAKNKSVGFQGEKIACDYLKKNKYKILHTNYKTKLGEIDIICENKEYIVFVEVKTRETDSIDSGASAVNRNKQTHIARVAYQYLKEYPSKKQPRFDVIEVSHNSKASQWNIEKHIDNAFFQGGEYAVF